MGNIGYIISEAEKLVAKHGTRDPFALCRAMNVAVRYKDCGATLNAYFVTVARVKNIVLNNRVGAVAARVLVAHELGHAVLHRELAELRGFREFDMFVGADPAEFEANMFAAELLVDDGELLEMLEDNDYSFYSVARALYVPAEILDYKFRAMKQKGYRIEPPNLARSDFLRHSIDRVSDDEFAE